MRVNLGMKVATNGVLFPVGVSLAFGLIWTSAATEDCPLVPGAQYPAGQGPQSVAIGDLDGDRVPDLAAVNWTTGKLTVLLNQCSMPGDIDGDGDVDLLDFALLGDCITGPDNGPYPDRCDTFDFDGDLDVDLADLSGLHRAFAPIR